MRLAEHHCGLCDRPRRDGSELLAMAIARMLSCVSRLPMVGLPIGANAKLVMASRHTDSGSESIVPAVASPRPLTAVCG